MSSLESSFSEPSGKSARVLDAARRLFIERGYGATSMDAIAAAAGVSKATVYAHHARKQTLFAAIIHRECRRVTAQMGIPGDVERLPPDAALERIARSFLAAGFSSDIMALLRMVIAETPRFPELGLIFYDAAPGHTLADVIGYIERARDHGQLVVADCELAASQFLGMLRGDLHLRALLGCGAPRVATERIAAEAVDLFLARYGRDGHPRTPAGTPAF